MKHRFFACLLALLLLAGVAGCGGSAEPDPNEGLYTAVRVGTNGMELDAGLVFEQGFFLDLQSGGKCVIEADGDKGRGKWALDGSALTVTEGSSKYRGTLADGILRLEDLDGEGMYIIFTREGVSLYDTGTPVDESFDNSWWTRDWFGWWHVSNCTGDFESWEDKWWNACAHIEGRGDQVMVVIWDQDLPRDNPVAEFSLRLFDNGTAHGSTESGRGYFMDMGLSGGELKITADDPNVEALKLEGRYEIGDGTFEIDAMFKPWGSAWNDVAADDIPYYYEDWYLPLVESGVTSAPDTIGPDEG